MQLRAIGIVLLTFPASVLPSHAKPTPSCAIVGDSIALGISMQMPACRHSAKVGIPSDAVIARVDASVEITIVSAGSNDPLNPKLRDNLKRIRNRAKRVIWVLPINAQARAAVTAVAAAHGDRVVSFAPAGDHVHPQSYAALAKTVAAVLP